MKTFLTLFLLTALPALGKIGDTLPVMEAKLGKSILLYTNDDGADVREFSFKEYQFDVAFLNGKSLVEGVAKSDDAAELSDSECKALAQIMSGATNWTLESKTKTATFWLSGEFIAERTERMMLPQTPKTKDLGIHSIRPSLRVEGQASRDHDEDLKKAKEQAEIKAVTDKFATNSPSK